MQFNRLSPHNTTIEILENSGHILNCDNSFGLTDLLINILKRNNLIEI